MHIYVWKRLHEHGKYIETVTSRDELMEWIVEKTLGLRSHVKKRKKIVMVTKKKEKVIILIHLGKLCTLLKIKTFKMILMI